MRSYSAAACALLLLAGCSGKQSGGNSGSSAAADTQTQEPDNLTTDQDNVATPVTPPSPTPLAVLPASYRGRWATVAQDCTSSGGDYLVVGADGVSIGGAGATIGSLADRGGGAVTGNVAVAGKPAHDERWTLTEGGRTLVRQTTSPAAALTYQRCPA